MREGEGEEGREREGKGGRRRGVGREGEREGGREIGREMCETGGEEWYHGSIGGGKGGKRREKEGEGRVEKQDGWERRDIANGDDIKDTFRVRRIHLPGGMVGWRVRRRGVGRGM